MRLNDSALTNARYDGDWVAYDIRLALVKQGANRVEIARGPGARRDPVLRDLQLSIHYARQATLGVGTSYRMRVAVTSKLPSGPVPLDPLIDFGRAIEQANGAGVLDSNSIKVYDPGSGDVIPHSLDEAFSTVSRDEFVGWPMHHGRSTKSDFERLRSVRHRSRRISRPSSASAT